MLIVKIFILFNLITVDSNAKILEPNISKNETVWVSYIKNILQRFENFDMNFYYYKNNFDDLKLLKEINSNKLFWPISIHNYYNNNSKLIRPAVSKIVHIIYELNEDVLHFLEPKTTKSTDVTILISRKNIKDKTLKSAGKFLKNTGNFLVIQKIGDENIATYKICYFCGQLSKKFILIDSTKNQNLNKKIEDKDLFPSKFMDLNGHKFKICMIEYFPMITCDKNLSRPQISQINQILSNVECTKVNGIEGKLLKIIAKSLNFSFEIFFMTSDAGWFDMIKLVNQNEIDFATGGISMTSERIPMVQFTQIFNYENYNLMYLFDLRFMEIFDNFMSPLKTILVWSLYLLAFFAVALVLSFIWKVRVGGKPGKTNFRNSLWSLFLVMIEQSNPYIGYFYQSRISSGLILSCWWCCSLIFSTMYKSTVLSATAYPPNLEPEDLIDLLEAEYKLVTNKQSADLIREILDGQGKIYKNALKNTGYGNDVCDTFSKILPGHVAMLDEQSTIRYEVRSTCAKPEDYQIRLLRICKKPVSKTGHAWATQLFAPYTGAINRRITTIIEAGLFEKWNKEAIQKFEGNQIHFAREEKTGGVEVLSLKSISPLFLIYFIGVTISITIFFTELLIFKHHNKNHAKKHPIYYLR